MFKKVFNIILVTSFFAASLNAQTHRAIQKAAENAMLDENFYGAAKLFENIRQKDSSDININYKLATCYAKTYEFQKAENLFLSIINKDSTAFHDIFFRLAMVQKSIEKYEKAEKNFTKCLKTLKDSNSFEYKKALHEIIVCKNIDSLVKHDDKITIQKIGSPINTTFSEMCPMPINDSLMLYASLQPDDYDSTLFITKIYQTSTTNKKKPRPSPIDSLINFEGFHTSNPYYCNKSGFLFFTRKKNNTEKNSVNKDYTAIYKSFNYFDQWQAAEVLNETINDINSNNTQPATANVDNTNYLIFASDREGGFGGYDLWYCHIKGDGSLSNPANMGETVNTQGNEITPFFDNDTQTLFFSSDWHGGLGGFDIFVSSGNIKNTNKPQNVGKPINTGYNDVYYKKYKQKTAWFVSNRNGGTAIKNESCCNDIYMYEIPADPETADENQTVFDFEDYAQTSIDSLIINTAFEASTERKVNIIKKLIDFTGDPLNEISKPNLNTKEEILKAKIEKALETTVYFENNHPDPGSRNSKTNENYKNLFDSYILQKNFYAKKYTNNQKNDLNEIAKNKINNFFDEKVLNGYQSLQFLADIIEQCSLNNKKVTLLLEGFSSPLGSANYNRILAARRTNSIENYLKEYKNGIFNNYIQNGTITIKHIVTGESKAAKTISDNAKEIEKSVFSPEAANERKVTIKITIK